MANNPQMAPFTITTSTGTDANGKPTAIATVNGVTYTCSGATAAFAGIALARRLVAEGFDPGCALATGVTLADIISDV